ncbi:ATP-binding cassette domain-containing protein [Ensifer canadensis]
MVFTTAGFASEGSPLADFNVKYKEKFGQVPDTVYIANGYDLGKVAIDAAVTEANSIDPVAIRNAIASLENVQGAHRPDQLRRHARHAIAFGLAGSHRRWQPRADQPGRSRRGRHSGPLSRHHLRSSAPRRRSFGRLQGRLAIHGKDFAPMMHSEIPAQKPLLEVSGLKVADGAVEALKGVDLTVNKGQIVTLLGANGAGKSSTLNALMGLAAKKAGRVSFNGQDISGLPPEQIVRLGMTLTPEGRRIFPSLTVDEHLLLGGAMHKARGVISDVREDMLSRFPILKERLSQKAGSLSGGEQQMLAIARSMMSSPDLLLLDEPSLGLAPQVVDLIFDLDRRSAPEGPDDPARRAERSTFARNRRRGLCHGERAHRALRHCRRTSQFN